MEKQKQLKRLREEKAQKISRMDELVSKVEKENRSYTKEETEEFEKLSGDVSELNKRIEALEKLIDDSFRPVDFSTRQYSEKDERDLSKYSLLRVIRSQCPALKEQLDGIELEMHQEAVREARESNVNIEGIGVPSFVLKRFEKRDMTAGTPAQGGYFVPTLVQEGIDPLRPRLVTAEAGAVFLTELQGNVSIPSNGGVSVTWKTENASADESNPTISNISLSPKRLTGYTDLSLQLIKQTSQSVEQMLRNDFLNALASTLDGAALAGSGVSGQPTGILSTAGIGSVAIGANGGAPLLTHITSLEEEVAIDNADIGSLYYITNPKVRRKLKNTFIDTGSGISVWDTRDSARPLNGYPALITNNVPSNLTKGAGTNLSAIIFGNFNDLIIGMWGGMDVMANPYTRAKDGLVEIIAAVYADVAVRRPVSFAAIVDAQTT